jgi:hypothetical protein
MMNSMPMTAPVCHFDHLVTGAGSLSQGVAWFEQLSGISIPYGGAHPRMGTHNHISAMGANSFIEIIAIDSGADKPDRPRWFNLDSPASITALSQTPQLLTWVVNTTDIDATLAVARQAGFDTGEVIEITRGSLRWRIAVRADGALVENGTFPIIIEWPAGKHPAAAMTDQGIRIKRIQLVHPQPQYLVGGLSAMGIENLAIVTQSHDESASIAAELFIGDAGVTI